jgi:hypothetical protein
MIPFSAMMVGGHLLIAVVDKVPDLNFEPICREGAGESLGAKNDSGICIRDENAARDELAKQWSEFESADRARCIRVSTMNRTASYVEVLTCLEMERDAGKLRQKAGIATDAPEQALAPAREKVSPPIRSVRLARHPAPVPLAPPESQPGSSLGILQIFCLPGLKTILPACLPSAGYR